MHVSCRLLVWTTLLSFLVPVVIYFHCMKTNSSDILLNASFCFWKNVSLYKIYFLFHHFSALYFHLSSVFLSFCSLPVIHPLLTRGVVGVSGWACVAGARNVYPPSADLSIFSSSSLSFLILLSTVRNAVLRRIFKSPLQARLIEGYFQLWWSKRLMC